MTKYEEYLICQKRGHVNGGMPLSPEDRNKHICDWCLTKYGNEIVEENVPVPDEKLDSEIIEKGRKVVQEGEAKAMFPKCDEPIYSETNVPAPEGGPVSDELIPENPVPDEKIELRPFPDFDYGEGLTHIIKKIAEDKAKPGGKPKVPECKDCEELGRRCAYHKEDSIRSDETEPAPGKAEFDRKLDEVGKIIELKGQADLLYGKERSPSAGREGGESWLDDFVVCCKKCEKLFTVPESEMRELCDKCKELDEKSDEIEQIGKIYVSGGWGCTKHKKVHSHIHTLLKKIDRLKLEIVCRPTIYQKVKHGYCKCDLCQGKSPF